MSANVLVGMQGFSSLLGAYGQFKLAGSQASSARRGVQAIRGSKDIEMRRISREDQRATASNQAAYAHGGVALGYGSTEQRRRADHATALTNMMQTHFEYEAYAESFVADKAARAQQHQMAGIQNMVSAGFQFAKVGTAASELWEPPLTPEEEKELYPEDKG